MHRPGRGAASPGAGADPALERQLEPVGFRAETDYRIDVEQISSTNELLALTADLMRRDWRADTNGLQQRVGASTSDRSIASIALLYGASRGAIRCGVFRGGGTADSNARRTVRRCTPCLSDNARIDSPSTR